MGKKKLFIVCCLLSLALAYPLSMKLRLFLIRPDVAIVGPIVMADGIGRQTVELAMALKNNFNVQITSKHVEKTDLPPDITKILRKKFKKPARVVIVEESLWDPGTKLIKSFSEVDSCDQIRYAYTMLESTEILSEWVVIINLYFDAIIVPDPFLVDAYQSSGVTVPIFCIPLGRDLDNFLNSPLKQPKTNEPLVFACLGTGIERKNHKMAIQAFAKALGNNENAILHINCRTALPEVRNEIISEIVKQDCKNIKYTELCLKDDAYLKFFRSIDCLLSLSKGEGFSNQPREAMALGIPVIATDNTGQSTICKSGLVKSVYSQIREPRYYFDRNINVGYHFNCNLDDAVEAIQDVYSNYTQYLCKGPMMREWASYYNFKNLIPLYESLIAPKKIILGTENRVFEDCIITSSQRLYDKYIKIMKLP
jgi:glycosyltransferase involved in cell wall biosynthesis